MRYGARLKNCVDCGDEFTARTPRQQRCPGCQTVHTAELEHARTCGIGDNHFTRAYSYVLVSTPDPDWRPGARFLKNELPCSVNPQAYQAFPAGTRWRNQHSGYLYEFDGRIVSRIDG